MATSDEAHTVVIEVFADITCPFTHVGLKRLVAHVEEMERPAVVRVRAWPLEWVNGTGLPFDAVAKKVRALNEQLGVDYFSELAEASWPETTLPALELAAQAYAKDAPTGLSVSIALRGALFEEGRDIGDPEVLAEIADAHGLTRPSGEHADAVRADYENGKTRNVAGSPHFWVGTDDFFCPALDLGHDDGGHLTARFDPAGLAAFFARIDG